LTACSGGAPSSQTTAKTSAAPAGSYTLFETLQVRPLALSPSGKLLFAVNTPDNRLEIFHVGGDGLEPIASVAVGLEPVAVAARSDEEVWVVNHLSDSVSIVRFGRGVRPHVARTLLVGDEPRDIVFAGANRDRAFITTAHRGQNSPDAYDLQTAGVGRADVWVFDANNLGLAAAGTRLTKITLFADTPRALAVSPDGLTVYAASFFSGNQTTSVSPEAVQKVYGGMMPPPTTISVGGNTFPQPPVGLIVKYNEADGHWRDANGTIFDPFVKIKLPDNDVFAIDASANPPAAVAGHVYRHVGTTLFNMVVNPANGKVYVTNTDARNHIRFEGHTAGFSSVRGHIVDSRITVINPGDGSVVPQNLNTHIDYTQDGNDAERALSVAFPQDVAVTRDGATLYTVAQGSSKLAVYRTADIEAGTITPRLGDQVVLSGGGPTGVVLDERRGNAYVLTRFDNSISIVSLGSRSEVGHVPMFSPEPASVTNGRRYLYDATFTSGHGDSACASCHIGGDNDALAWDLGNPGGIPLTITKLGTIFTIDPAIISALLPRFAGIFAFNMPLKGPMTTQSLRGMDNHGAMHWRGDRNGAVKQDGTPDIDPTTGQPVVSAQPNAGIYDEEKAFTSFNVAFPGLVGRSAQLTDSDMLDFAHFILQVTYPPNPVRNLDNSLTPEQQIGHDFYFNSVATPNGAQELPSDRFHNCNGCHTLDPKGNLGQTAHPGFFGSDGRLSFELESQVFKVPHLRNMYTKVGMFGSSPDSLQPGTLFLPEQQAPAQDAVRGFGFNHDGVLGQLEHFFTGQVFIKMTVPVHLPDGTTVPPNPFGIPFIDLNALFANPPTVTLVEDGGFKLRHAIVAFMMAYDSNMAPVVGQQMTLTALNAPTANPRIDLLEARATVGECDLVAKGGHAWGREIGYLFSGGAWTSDTGKKISDADLRALTSAGCFQSQTLTFTCVPPGEGVRVALDRDGDGFPDGAEIAAGTDPANAASHP
jgi:DNA-binding beta-propeller fold protein YncE